MNVKALSQRHHTAKVLHILAVLCNDDPVNMVAHQNVMQFPIVSHIVGQFRDLSRRQITNILDFGSSLVHHIGINAASQCSRTNNQHPGCHIVTPDIRGSKPIQNKPLCHGNHNGEQIKIDQQQTRKLRHTKHIQNGRHQCKTNQVQHQQLDQFFEFAALMQCGIIPCKGITADDHQRIKHAKRKKSPEIPHIKCITQRQGYANQSCTEVGKQNKKNVQHRIAGLEKFRVAVMHKYNCLSVFRSRNGRELSWNSAQPAHPFEEHQGSGSRFHSNGSAGVPDNGVSFRRTPARPREPRGLPGERLRL